MTNSRQRVILKFTQLTFHLPPVLPLQVQHHPLIVLLTLTHSINFINTLITISLLISLRLEQFIRANFQIHTINTYILIHLNLYPHVSSSLTTSKLAHFSLWLSLIPDSISSSIFLPPSSIHRVAMPISLLSAVIALSGSPQPISSSSSVTSHYSNSDCHWPGSHRSSSAYIASLSF